MDATGRSTKRAALPQEASTAAVASVFGNGDLLRDILLCLNFPTYLVHAALVSKHWLRHASDPVFLRRFRQLHPPCLLGFFVVASGCPKLHRLPFEPMLLPEDGGDGTSCTAVALMLNSLDYRRAWVQLFDLQAGAWGEGRTSDLIELPQKWSRRVRQQLLLAYGKLYIILGCPVLRVPGFISSM